MICITSWMETSEYKIQGQNPRYKFRYNVELFDGNILINDLPTTTVASSCGPWWVSALPTAFAHPIAMTGTPETSLLEGTRDGVGCHAMERLAYTCHLEGTEIASGYLKCSFHIAISLWSRKVRNLNLPQTPVLLRHYVQLY